MRLTMHFRSRWLPVLIQVVIAAAWSNALLYRRCQHQLHLLTQDMPSA